MPRRAAAVTQADVARAIRAAKQEGRDFVSIPMRSGCELRIEGLSRVTVLPNRPLPAPPEPLWITAQRRDAMGFPGSRLYFIGAGSRAIKIGISGSPEARLRDLQTAHYETLVVIGFMQGHEATESALHQDFAKEHLRGEWFRASKRLRQFIEVNRIG